MVQVWGVDKEKRFKSVQVITDSQLSYNSLLTHWPLQAFTSPMSE
jgi:hypothetical protein